MSFTLNNSNSAFDGSSGTSLGVTVTGVNSGDLVCVFVGNDSADHGPITVSDGTSSLTGGTYPASTNVFGRMFYLLSSVATGSVTYTATWATATTGRGIGAYVFTPSGAVSFDQETAGFASSTAIDSGNITTTGTDELVFGATLCENGGTTPLINGLAATGSQSWGFGGSTMWYRAFASTFTGSASFTQSAGGWWVCGVMAFKITGGGGGSVKRTMLMGIG